MSESYITDRYFVKFVRSACERYDITCVFFSDDWVAIMQKNNVRRGVFGYNFDINSTGATSIAADKVAASMVLAAAGVPAVDHYLLRSRATELIRRENVAHIPDDMPVVIKPLAGTSGHGVRFCQNKHEAFEHVDAQSRSDWAMSPYYEIVVEKRFVLLDDEVLVCYEKQADDHGSFVQFNLSKGAKAVVCNATDEELGLAYAAQRALGLRLAAVDVAVLWDGRIMVVEVNTGLMMEYFAHQSTEYHDIAQSVYDKVIETMMR